MRFIGFLAGCIDDKQQMVSTICDHQVIKNSASCIGKEGVPQLPRGQVYDIDWNEPPERLACLPDIFGFRAQDNLAHMRYIEKTGGRACMKMLLEYAKRVLDWHLVPSKGYHPRSQFLVQSV